MNVNAYVSYLIKHFNKNQPDTASGYPSVTVGSKWFGVLPFLWKWVLNGAKTKK